MAIKEMKAKHGTPKEKIASGKTKDGHDYFINEYPATKTYSQWERVGYVQLPQAVAYIVLTSRDQASYQKDSGALEKVLKTLVYVEPKSETASGQEYARRYRQLLDQHADGQIEPLLTEWREKAPDDPDAWITSANYYFNQRQTNISTKKPGPGDITLTDKKGKLAGSISFEQTNENMKRAVDLLQEATTKFPDHLDIWCGLAFMYQESGDFDNELATLKKMVAYAREHPTQLKWLKGEPLSEPADKFVPEQAARVRFVLREKGESRRMISAGTKLRHWQPTNIQMTRKASKMQPVIGPILANGKRRASRSKKRTNSIRNPLGRWLLSDRSALR